ncbi:MAG: ATP-binding cassette domain-containing protein [Mesorhizobium sp.]|nr:MAG: ATP-binding cassette domain-containing protein [Mesorhizobium sp.]
MLLTSETDSMASPNVSPLLRLDQVTKRFVKPLDIAARVANIFGAGLKEQVVSAVDSVTLEVCEGEVLGLVGESGCGKSTLGRIAAGILGPTAGRVLVAGHDLHQLRGNARRKADLESQMVFQDPMASLNPRMEVDDIIGEAPIVHGLISRNDRKSYVADIMKQVGLDPAVRRRYPHQFSGGQRARIGIARALAVRPRILVCDEATAALDVSIQAQIINLFMQLRSTHRLTYLFISHDLGVVEHVADRVAVMYLGRVVELTTTTNLFAAPNHPYTRALLSDIPRLEARKRRFSGLKDELPSPLNPPAGCHFHPRCPFASERCQTERPALRQIAPAHYSACHLNG